MKAFWKVSSLLVAVGCGTALSAQQQVSQYPERAAVLRNASLDPDGPFAKYSLAAPHTQPAQSALPLPASASVTAADADAPSEALLDSFRAPDPNDEIYYRNKLEFSLEQGVLFCTIPFVYDVFVGGDYSTSPQKYTLLPLFPSIRWHMGKLSGPGFLRGNTDMTATLSLTGVARGPEDIYGAFDLGWRRNFVQRNWKIAPYFEARAGMGFINAQEPHGAYYGQGQDFTFTLMNGIGFRYNISPKQSFELAGEYMHVSNLYLSEPKYDNNGINVVGPWIGWNYELTHKHKQ